MKSCGDSFKKVPKNPNLFLNLVCSKSELEVVELPSLKWANGSKRRGEGDAKRAFRNST